MPDILKTWPAHIDAKTTAKVFDPKHPPFNTYWFSLGRGKPKQTVERMWFTYGGRIIGSMKIQRIVVNDGTLPKLTRLDGEESGWQFKRDVWVAACEVPCARIRERVFHDSFRGWRYFDFEAYRQTGEARHRFV